MPQILITLPDDTDEDVEAIANDIEEMLGMAGVVIDSVKHGDDPTGLRAVQADLLHRMRALCVTIEDFASMPAADFYKPGDYAADKARLLWVESARILDVPGSWNNVITRLYDRCRNLRWGLEDALEIIGPISGSEGSELDSAIARLKEVLRDN